MRRRDPRKVLSARACVTCLLAILVAAFPLGAPAFAQVKAKEKEKAAKPAPQPALKAVKKVEKKAEAKEETDANAGASQDADAAADPAVPSAYWVIDFEFKALHMISPKEGLGTGRVFWYMLYTLANSTPEDRDIFVNVTATSDNNKRYADLYLPSVEKAIERRENTPLWGKTDEFELTLKRKPSDPRYHYVTLKAGEKRSCVAVFNQLDPNANKITIRVAGLSNEIKEIVKEDGSRFLEERVREISFDRPGDEHAITLDSFTLVGTDWVKKQVSAPLGGAAGAGGPAGSAAGPDAAAGAKRAEAAGGTPEK